MKAEGFVTDVAMVRECVLVGALNMARGGLVRLQSWLRGTRNLCWRDTSCR